MVTNKVGPVGLYRPEFEHDACGVGMVADILGRKSHGIISKGLEVLDNLAHRGAAGSDPLTGDGAGVAAADCRGRGSTTRAAGRLSRAFAGPGPPALTVGPPAAGVPAAAEKSGVAGAACSRDCGATDVGTEAAGG